MSELAYYLVVIGIPSLIFIFLIVSIYRSKKGRSEELQKEEIKFQVELERIILDAGIRGDVFWTNNNLWSERTALSLNEEESSVIILKLPGLVDLKSGRKNFETQKISFRDIIEVKVNSNSTTITSTSRGSQIGGAVVGGVLLGGVGAVVGGLSGKTKSTESISKLVLEIVVNLNYS